MSVTSVFTVEALEQVLEQTGGHEVLEAGEALQAAGYVTRAEPAYLGVSGTVRDEGAEHRVWVGIRQWMLVGECDCPDADPLVSSEEHLAAVAAGQAETAGPCVHAVALAVAAIEQQLPWATPPQEPQPGTDRRPRTTPPPPLDITSVFPELAAFARQAVRLHPRRGQLPFNDLLGGTRPTVGGYPAVAYRGAHPLRRQRATDRTVLDRVLGKGRRCPVARAAAQSPGTWKVCCRALKGWESDHG